MALWVPDFITGETYSARTFRFAFGDIPPQEGVQGSTVDPLPMLVTRVGSSNRNAQVNAGSAWVDSDFGSAPQGRYHVVNNALVQGTGTSGPLYVPDNASGLGRIDGLFLRITDTFDGGSGTDAAAFEIIQGTPTSGATLSNLTGAPATPSSAILLANIRAPAGSVGISPTDILDRRPWAQGAQASTSQDSSPGTFTIGTTGNTTLASPRRLEIQSGLVRIKLDCWVSTAASIYDLNFRLRVDGANVNPVYTFSNQAASVQQFPVGLEWITAVAAGTHLFEVVYFGSTTALTTFNNDAGFVGGVAVAYEEILLPQAWAGAT